jgi:flavin-dependent dehydrogenase
MIPPHADVAIAGGGPAGLAVAIEAAARGLSALVLERRRGLPDKACGEGVLPAGVAHLVRLGVVDRLGPDDARPFAGIRWVQEDGLAVEGRFARGATGLGIRRTALVAALADRAREAGAAVHAGVEVLRYRASPDGVRLDTSSGPLAARVLIAADGLASPLRRAAGLDRRAGPRARRFGVRRHFAIAPWTDLVEVHWAEGAEAYVTPAGTARVGVAILFAPERTGRVAFDDLLARFPALRERLAGTPALGRDLGAGPLARASRDCTAPGLALVGDAAGYLDAITGEGISLALGAAAALGEALPAAIEAGATRASLVPYARALARARLRYVGSTAPVLLLARRPALRRRVFAFLAAHPPLFERLLGVVAAPARGRPTAGATDTYV